jgi:uncharacterized protein YerC
MCTINELQAMAQRWQVARQLDAGETYQISRISSTQAAQPSAASIAVWNTARVGIDWFSID